MRSGRAGAGAVVAVEVVEVEVVEEDTMIMMKASYLGLPDVTAKAIGYLYDPAIRCG
jgi:hypothetical protein